jgi:hypothetical protein
MHVVSRAQFAPHGPHVCRPTDRLALPNSNLTPPPPPPQLSAMRLRATKVPLMSLSQL